MASVSGTSSMTISGMMAPGWVPGAAVVAGAASVVVAGVAVSFVDVTVAGAVSFVEAAVAGATSLVDTAAAGAALSAGALVWAMPAKLKPMTPAIESRPSISLGFMYLVWF